MLNSSQQERYLYNTVQQASPAQLLIMLYDGAIRNCKLAMQHLQKEDYAAANTHLLKAQDIVEEFMCTLNMDYPVSDGLYKLYEYCVHLLIQANVKKSAEPVQEVTSYLTELRETWIQIAKTPQTAVKNA